MMTDPLHYLSVDNAVTAVAFGSWEDGKHFLAVGESDGTLTVWDTRSWRYIRKIAGSSGSILWLHFTNDGMLIVQVSSPNLRVFWKGFLPLYDPLTSRRHETGASISTSWVTVPNMSE